MSLFGFTIVKEKPGVISQDSCWVCFYGAWMHTGRSLFSLAWSVVAEFKHDDHLVG